MRDGEGDEEGKIAAVRLEARWILGRAFRDRDPELARRTGAARGPQAGREEASRIHASQPSRSPSSKSSASPSGDGKLAPGANSFRAVLDTEKAAGATWKGKASSPPAKLTVKPPSAALSGDEECLVALAEIRVLDALGRGPEAQGACDRYLGTHAGDGLILEERGDTLSRLGRPAHAIKAHDEVLSRVEPLPAGAVEEPPVGLIRKRQAAAMAAAKAK